MKLTTARTWDLKGRGRSLLIKKSTENWNGSTKANGTIRGHFGSRAISVQVSIVAASVHVSHKFPFDLLSQVSTTQLSFFAHPSAFTVTLARVMTHYMSLLGTPLEATSSNFGPPNGSSPDFDNVGVSQNLLNSTRNLQRLRRSPCWCKALPDSKIPIRRFHNQWPPLQPKVQTLSGSLVASQARVAALEAGAISASSVCGSAGSWPPPGRTDGSTATEFREPSASDDNWNTRRGLDRDSDPDDDNALSAALLRFSCEQCHAGMSAWIRKHMLQLISQRGSTVKEELNQLDSCLPTEPSVEVSWQGTNKMASSTQSAARSATPRVRSLCGDPSHKNFGRLEHYLRRYGMFWKRSCELFSLSTTVKVHFLFQPLIFAPRHSTFLIAGTKLECQFSGLTLFS